MRRRSPESARRWRALSTADRAPRSRKSFGVQTSMDLSRRIRSRIARLRSRFGPRRGGAVCPIFVDIFRTDPQVYLSEERIHFSDKFRIPQYGAKVYSQA